MNQTILQKRTSDNASYKWDIDKLRELAQAIKRADLEAEKIEKKERGEQYERPQTAFTT